MVLFPLYLSGNPFAAKHHRRNGALSEINVRHSSTWTVDNGSSLFILRNVCSWLLECKTVQLLVQEVFSLEASERHFVKKL